MDKDINVDVAAPDDLICFAEEASFLDVEDFVLN